ncbi:MAG: DNA internalization-related competence protein ComEC/Rec2 [Dehalococcoidia bacterium]|nr:DNA internalization-related competence protein ComEC/Rec2 [Dehalococcoidia bacterium]
MTLAYLAAAWALGIVVAALGREPPWPAVAAGVLLAVLPLLRRKASLALLALACVASFSGGVLRYQTDEPPEQPGGIALFNDTRANVTFRAVVTDEPDERERSLRVRLETKEVLENGEWRPTEGGVLMRQGLFPRYRYGDLIEVRGALETPPELDFGYRDYLARQGIVSVIDFPQTDLLRSGEGNVFMSSVHSLRRSLSSALAKALPEPQAALAQGILLGERSVLPQNLTDALNATSTSHIIALSGYNVTVISALVIGAFAWLIGRYRAALLALAVIAGYVVLTGASPSLVRAAIMGGLYLLANITGRQSSGVISLLFAAALMTGLDPSVVHDVSFQLSFAAAAGLITLGPLLYRQTADFLVRLGAMPTHPSGLSGMLVETAAVTAAAIAATLPLIALHFHRVSLIALPANLLVVPVFPLILLSSTAVALVALLSGAVADILAWPAWAVLKYMTEVVRLLAGLPFASIEWKGFTAVHAAAAYSLLFAAALSFSRYRPSPQLLEPLAAFFARLSDAVNRPLRRLPAVWVIAGLAVANVLVWAALILQPAPRLEITIFDVGQGDAILIRTPAGHNLLIDGGPSGRLLTEALGDELPFWDRELDMVVLTHPDSDHLTGLVSALERYDVEQVLTGAQQSDSDAFEAWREALDEEGAPVHVAAAGHWIDLGDGARLEVLGPPPGFSGSGPESNDASLVLKLTWRKASFLFTGDAANAAENALIESGADLRAAVLKVSHHGSAYSTSRSFLDAVRPAIAAISVGDDNIFGHPSAATLGRLQDTLVLRTDEQGQIDFSTDGERLWIATERPLPEEVLR